MARLRAAGSESIMRCFPHGALIVFDDDLRYLSAGGLGLSDVGLSREMLEGRTIFEVFGPEVTAVIEPFYRRALHGEESTMDVPYLDRVYLQRLGPLTDDDGTVVAGLGFTQDVTEARRAEQELGRARERLRLAFEHAPIGEALIGLDGRYEQVNPAFCHITRYPAAQLTAMTITDLTHPDDLAPDLAATARLVAGEMTSYTLEKRYLDPAGETIWVEKSAALMSGDDGSPGHIVAQIVDITERRDHERALAAERRRLHEAELVGRVGSWDYNLQTQRLAWSVGMFRLRGIDPDQFDGDFTAAMSHVHPDDAVEVRAAIELCARTGESMNIRYRATRVGDGSSRWFDARAERFDSDGEGAHLAGTATDVNDRVVAEAEAAANRAFQDAVFSASPDVTFVWDLVARSAVWANRGIGDQLGHPAAVGPESGETLLTRLLRDDMGTQWNPVPFPVGAGAAPVSQRTVRLPHADASTRIFSLRTTPMRGAAGARAQVVGVLRDITEETAAEQALQDSEERLRTLADNVDIGFVLRRLDPPEFLYVSPKVAQILGDDTFAQNETPAQSAARVHPDDLDRYRTEYWSRAGSGLAVDMEYRIIRPSGEVRWVRTRTAPVPDRDGVIRRSAATVEDTTDRRRAEAALAAAAETARANAAKNEFLSRMSHELRTPLNAVLGFAQLLEMDPLTAEQGDAVKHIMRGGRHLVGLIDDVLDIAKIESDRLDVSMEAVPVSDLLAETVALMGPLAAASGIQLHYHPQGGGGRRVHADNRRLRQVVLNLLSNAIKYNRPGGRVDVRCSVSAAESDAADQLLVITVADTGVGIRTVDLPRLFIPFDRLDAQHSGIEGTGVGLALSHRLMTAMGGSLTARSQFGVGTTFSAALPLSSDRWPIAPAPAALSPARPDAVVDTPNWTALYIEDISSNIALMGQVVARRGQWRMLTAADGAGGLTVARAERPDLILLDLHLPGMSGLEVLHALRADPLTYDLHVVVVSADANPHQIERLVAAGARGYLTKPLDVADVLRILDGAEREATELGAAELGATSRSGAGRPGTEPDHDGAAG